MNTLKVISAFPQVQPVLKSAFLLGKVRSSLRYLPIHTACMREKQAQQREPGSMGSRPLTHMSSWATLGAGRGDTCILSLITQGDALIKLPRSLPSTSRSVSTLQGRTAGAVCRGSRLSPPSSHGPNRLTAMRWRPGRSCPSLSGLGEALQQKRLQTQQPCGVIAPSLSLSCQHDSSVLCMERGSTSMWARGCCLRMSFSASVWPHLQG